MKIRGHGNAVAIALAALALAVAATGTAVAVTTNNVRIADGKSATKLATVDSTGKLGVAGYQSTLGYATNSTGSAIDNFATGPTTAVLAVTHLSFDAAASNTDPVRVGLYQVPVQSDGSCSTTGVLRVLVVHTLQPGAHTVDEFPNPLIVRGSGSTRYCLDIYQAGNGAPIVYLNFAAAVTYGTYTAPAGIARTARLPKGKTFVSR